MKTTSPSGQNVPQHTSIGLPEMLTFKLLQRGYGHCSSQFVPSHSKIELPRIDNVLFLLTWGWHWSGGPLNIEISCANRIPTLLKLTFIYHSAGKRPLPGSLYQVTQEYNDKEYTSYSFKHINMLQRAF